MQYACASSLTEDKSLANSSLGRAFWPLTIENFKQSTFAVQYAEQYCRKKFFLLVTKRCHGRQENFPIIRLFAFLTCLKIDRKFRLS
jgi:hypothetical protein